MTLIKSKKYAQVAFPLTSFQNFTYSIPGDLINQIKIGSCVKASIRRKERIDQLCKHININKDKVRFQDHHLSHASAAYFGSPFDLNKETLILTCDGAGDGLSATVSIGNGLEIKRISSTNRKASVGKIYSRVTYMLGLKPWEHEYKVMGLAPYSENKFALEIKKILDFF